MAPPRQSTVPLLRDIDPKATAIEVVTDVMTHISHVAFSLSPGVDCHLVTRDHDGKRHSPNPADVAASSTLGSEVQALVLYAQRGLPVWDWTDHGCASDACLSVMSALYACAGDSTIGGGDLDDDELEPRDAIGTVLIAARARIRLDQGTPVDARELAVLAGLSTTQVRSLMRSGEIPHVERTAAPEDARRWLASRGVAA